jgi:hypothetical protein
MTEKNFFSYQLKNEQSASGTFSIHQHQDGAIILTMADAFTVLSYSQIRLLQIPVAMLFDFNNDKYKSYYAIRKIPHWAQECAVKDCDTVELFLKKYMKPSRYTARGKDYVDRLISSHQEDIINRGYTAISHHESITGAFVSFIPKPEGY